MRPRRSLPLNLTHLSRQTMGDRKLEQEVLSLFAHQAGVLRAQLAQTTGQDRQRLAHKLKGAAAAVGAEQLAECAEAIMGNPMDAAGMRRLSAAIDEARAFIARFTR